MKIRTQEIATKYETWEYEFEDDFKLPDDFADWNGEDKYSWLSMNTYDARLIDSDWDGGTVTSFDIII